ncbi:MAG TPA: hypothetical protein VFT56_06135 [Sphingomonas sp.]|nr:hypothetical protein [Sphingomonas sp.]
MQRHAFAILPLLALVGCQSSTGGRPVSDNGHVQSSPGQEILQSPAEPKTQADLDILVKQYRAASFAVSLDQNHRLSCRPTSKFDSALLSVKTCIVAAQCLQNGIKGAEALSQCTDKGKAALLRDYVREWHKAYR